MRRPVCRKTLPACASRFNSGEHSLLSLGLPNLAMLSMGAAYWAGTATPGAYRAVAMGLVRPRHAATRPNRIMQTTTATNSAHIPAST